MKSARGLKESRSSFAALAELVSPRIFGKKEKKEKKEEKEEKEEDK